MRCASQIEEAASSGSPCGNIFLIMSIIIHTQVSFDILTSMNLGWIGSPCALRGKPRMGVCRQVSQTVALPTSSEEEE